VIDPFQVRQAPFLSRRNYVHEIRHIIGWGVVAGIVEGNIAAVVVAKIFDAGPLLINIAATTPVASHLANLLWGMLCVGRRKIRLMTLATSGVVCMLAAVALVPATRWGAWIYVIQIATAQFFMTGVVTMRSALWKANYPQFARGRMTTRVLIVRTVMQLFSLGAGAAILNSAPGLYRLLYPAVALIGLISIRPLQAIHVRGERNELARIRSGSGSGISRKVGLNAVFSPRSVFSGAFHVLRADVAFRRYCIAQMFAGLANLIVRSVAVAVIAEELLGDMPAAFWTGAVLLEVLPRLVSVGSMPRFATYYDRVGVIRFRVIHGTCWLMTLLLGTLGAWSVARHPGIDPRGFLAGIGFFTLFALMQGVCFGGGAIAWNIGHLDFADPQDAEVYMGIHVSLTGLRGLIMPSVGMLLWHGVGGWPGIGWGVWIVACAFSVVALVVFASMARTDALLQSAATATRHSAGAARRSACD